MKGRRNLSELHNRNNEIKTDYVAPLGLIAVGYWFPGFHPGLADFRPAGALEFTAKVAYLENVKCLQAPKARQHTSLGQRRSRRPR